MDKRMKVVGNKPKYNLPSTSSSNMSKRTTEERKNRAPVEMIPRPVIRRSLDRNPSHQDRYCPHQFFWKKNLNSAQTTVMLANRWIVNLLHILLETVRASAASKTLPNLHFLEYLPVFQSVPGTCIRRPLYRQKCSPDKMKDEENAMERKQGVTQSSIKELLEELNLLRDIYNKQANPRTQVTPRTRHSNLPGNNKKVRYVKKKVMYIDLASPVIEMNSKNRVDRQ